MEAPRTYEDMKRQAEVFDAGLKSLDGRLAVLEANRPPFGSDRTARRNQERWQKKMIALTGQGEQWGRDYLEFLRLCVPLLAEWASRNSELQSELVEWRESLSQMEKSAGR